MRTVVIGLGWLATEVWLPRLLAHPGFKVVGAVEPTASPAPVGLPVYRDHREVPAEDVDCVFVLTPNHTHGEIGAWFLRRGCHVVLEKPSCTRAEEIDGLAEAARAGGGRLSLSAVARHRADVMALSSIVASGALGTPRLADLSWIRARGIPGSPWFTSHATSGGGALVDLGWHLLDAAHHLWGPARVRTAAAQATADFLHRPGWAAHWHGAAVSVGGDEAEPNVEDQLTALVTTDSYTLRLRFAWASHEDLDRTTIVLHGTDGSAELLTTFGLSPNRIATPSLRLKRGGQVEEIRLPACGVGDEFDRQLDALAAPTVDAGAATDRALTCARDVLSIVDACYTSTRGTSSRTAQAAAPTRLIP
jgi:oxidoreductase